MMRRLFTFLSVLIVAAIALSGQSAYAAIDKKGARELKSLFESILRDQSTRLSLRGEKMETDGEIMVEPAGTYYAVTLPHLSVIQRDGNKISFGIIAVNALPDKDPDQWKMTLALPTPITVYSPQGQILALVNIGKQNFAGIWNTKLRGYKKLQAQYSDIDLSMMGGIFTLKLPALTIAYNLEKNEKNLWSGALRFELSRLTMTMMNETGIGIESARTSVNISDYDPREAIAYRENIAALNESYNAGEESVSTAHIMAIYNLITEFIGKASDAVTMSMEISNISIIDKGGIVKIPQASTATNISGFHSGQIAIGAKAGYQGLSIEGALADTIKKSTPDSAEINLNVTGLPYQDIVAMGRETIEKIGENQMQQGGNLVPLIGLQALLNLPQILTKAQTSLVIKDNHIGNKDYNIKLNGALTADMNAAKGATGTGMIEARGLDKLIAALGTDIKNSKYAENEASGARKTLALLMALQLAGEKNKSNGNLTFNVELNREGKYLLNGKDMTLLIEAVTP